MATNAEGIVVLGFFALISTPIVAGLIATNNLQHRAVVEVQERIFTTACRSYKAATTWERWTTPVYWESGWCDEYLDRMEG